MDSQKPLVLISWITPNLIMSVEQAPHQFKGVIDTTIRDGQQSPLLFDTYTYRFDTENKLNLVKGLSELGVKKIEFFSPVVSESEGSDFAVIRDYVKSEHPDVQLLAHCRTHEDDVEAL
jgi:homocitrate synthase